LNAEIDKTKRKPEQDSMIVEQSYPSYCMVIVLPISANLRSSKIKKLSFSAIFSKIKHILDQLDQKWTRLPETYHTQCSQYKTPLSLVKGRNWHHVWINSSKSSSVLMSIISETKRFLVLSCEGKKAYRQRRASFSTILRED